jgi:putative NADH-flavin reductase
MRGMQVAFFGAGDGLDHLVLRGARERGHHVTALVPAREAAAYRQAHVDVLDGDVFDGGKVSDVVDGREAAIVTLAATRGRRRPSMAVQGTLNVVRSMQRYRVRRLVVLSEAGSQPGSDPNLPWFRQHVVKPLLLRGSYAELRRMEIVVRQSQLDWTLVRVPRLVDGEPRGRYRVGPGYSLPGGGSMARADVATFLLDELERGDNIAHAVVLGS